LLQLQQRKQDANRMLVDEAAVAASTPLPKQKLAYN
jgi:hypothetical protein